MSPLLLALLEQEGLSIDSLAWQLRPADGWPYRPKLPAGRTKFHSKERDIGRPLGSLKRVERPFDRSVGKWHGVEISNPNGDRIGMHVVDQAIEMAARLDGDWYTMLHGRAQIAIGQMRLDEMPAAHIGRLLAEALPLSAVRGRGWIMHDVNAPLEFAGIELMVRTGMKQYRLPWVR